MVETDFGTLTRYDLLSMNEIRTLLYEMGVEYPDNANRAELIALLKKAERS